MSAGMAGERQQKPLPAQKDGGSFSCIVLSLILIVGQGKGKEYGRR